LKTRGAACMMPPMRRSVVSLLFVISACACADNGSDGSAGSGGTFAAGTGGIPGTSGAGGMAAGASGASGMAGMTAAGSGGMAGGGMGGAGGAGGAGGMTENCLPEPNQPPQANFTWIFTNVFPTCGGPLCHSGAAGGNLVFDSKDGAHMQLMMAGMGMNLGPSTPTGSMTHCKDAGMMRVVPSNPDMSLLYNKLRTDMPAPCGNRMPPGGALCSATIEAIRMWIAMGAPNN
jgi:hypothetical protein